MDIELIGKKHTAHGLNFYLTHLDLLARALDRDHYAFLVGGWVRDRLLGKAVGKHVDIDILTTQDPKDLSKRFLEELYKVYGIKGEHFEFDKKEPWIKRGKISTAIFNEGDFRYRFDIAILGPGVLKTFFGLKRPSTEDWEKILEEDLKDRDFTCNAIAINLDDVLSVGAKQTILFDPTGGIKDLENGILRPISYENLKKDPIRLLRGIRIAYDMDLELPHEFYSFLENHHLLKDVVKERIDVEFFKILKLRHSNLAMEKLFETKLIYDIIPELIPIQEVKDQGKHHIYPLEKHTLKVYEYANEILESENTFGFDKEILNQIRQSLPRYTFLGEFGIKEGIKLSALFHDIGKPHTLKIDESGNISFHQHEKVGAELIKNVSNRLGFGEELSKFLQKMVLMHLRIFYLRETLNEITPKAYAKLLREAQEDIYPLMMLTIADALGSNDDEPIMRALEITIKSILDFKSQIPKERQTSLLNGNEIMKILNLSPGKTIGIIKNKLLELQYEGLISSKDEATLWVKNLNLDELNKETT